MMEYRGLRITWLGHDGFRINTPNKEIVIDPYKLRQRGKRPADIVFITHEHFDHCSKDDLRRVVDPSKTTVIAAKNCKEAIEGLGARNVRYVSPGDSGEVDGVRYQAVPAYNVNKYRSPGVVFHPKEYGGVGFIIEIGGTRIYHPGDTDHIEEMRRLGRIDVAFIPVSGTYVMTAEEAAKAVEDIKPEVAIPMHYGSIVGSRRDAERFSKLAKCRVAILEEEE